jgi:hypothetical protein
MKATFLTTAILSLFMTSCVSSMVTANNNSAATEFNSEVPAKGTVEKKQLDLTEVPTMVLAAMKKAYPNELIRQTTRFSAQDAVYYEFQIQNKRKKPVSVYFNANGKEENLSSLRS